MNGGTATPGSPVQRNGPRLGIRTGAVAAGRGLAFCGLMLAGAALLLAFVLSVALIMTWLGVVLLLSHMHDTGSGESLRLILGLAMTLAGLGLGVLLLPAVLLGMRRLANLTRQLAGQWCGVPIAAAYRPLPPGAASGEISFRARLEWLLGDAATWRDLLWVLTNACVGWILAAIPAGLAALGLIAFIGPVLNPPIAIPPPAFPGNTKPVLVLLGLACVAVALWTAPWLLRAYGWLARSMLEPAGQVEMAQRVRHLAQTRTETIDSGAAAMRQIERDLHDGAQARLVAMGMTLDAAGQVLDTNPDAARVLLAEAREASARALTELRDLVRGIHPPVLADRGLAEAVRALALDTPLRVHLACELPGRPPAAVESAAYFAVSELLANVAKHAGARETWVDIRHSGGMLRVGVTDTGCGGADPARGTGLSGIERRLAAFDGVLAVSSPPGGPTTVTMEIPCALSSPKTSSS